MRDLRVQSYNIYLNRANILTTFSRMVYYPSVYLPIAVSIIYGAG